MRRRKPGARPAYGKQVDTRAGLNLGDKSRAAIGSHRELLDRHARIQASLLEAACGDPHRPLFTGQFTRSPHRTLPDAFEILDAPVTPRYHRLVADRHDVQRTRTR